MAVLVGVKLAVFTPVAVAVPVKTAVAVGVLMARLGLTGDCRLRVAQAKAPAINPTPKRMIQNRAMVTPEK